MSFHEGVLRFEALFRGVADGGVLQVQPFTTWSSQVELSGAARCGRPFLARVCSGNKRHWLDIVVALPSEPFLMKVVLGTDLVNFRVKTGDPAFDAVRNVSTSNPGIALAILDPELRRALQPFLSICSARVEAEPGAAVLSFGWSSALEVGTARLGAFVDATFLLADKAHAAIAAAQAKAPRPEAWRAEQARVLAELQAKRRKATLLILGSLALVFVLAGTFIVWSTLSATSQALPPAPRPPAAHKKR